MEWPVLKAYSYGEGEDRNAKRLRKQGYVPFSVYHKNSKPVFYKAKSNELVRFFVHHPQKMNIELDIDGKETKKVVFKEIQRDPVMDDVIHMDFYEMVEGLPFKVMLPVRFTGIAAGVKEGGVFERHVTYLEIMTTPEYLPDTIEMDISELEIGDCLYLKDLPDPKGMKFLGRPRMLICNIVTTRVAKQDEEELEGEELEGEETAEAQEPVAE